LSLTIMAATKFFPAQMERLNGLRPANITDAQVTEFMSQVSTNQNPTIKVRGGYTRKVFEFDPSTALNNCIVLPETNLFTASGLAAIHGAVTGEAFAELQQQPLENRVSRICSPGSWHRAMRGGWISWTDIDLQPADCRAFLHTNFYPTYSRTNLDDFMAHGESWSWVKAERFPVVRLGHWAVPTLWFLRATDSLDLVDREKLIQQIAAVQTLSEHPPGNPPIHDWKDVRGLFFTPCHPALVDTYHSLAALEILGGLDKIDREACIKGILRVHHGKGFFKSPDSGSYNEYHIDGTAQDTIAAYESLRILGALDRVKDLDKWIFRVSRRHLKNDEITWRDIEAWTAQRRLQKIVQEHQANPAAPWRSLLEP
jgi:hypothetical protein